MKKVYLFIWLTTLLIACGSSDIRNFNVEEEGGYSYLVQIPMEDFMTELTNGYTDPEFRDCMDHALSNEAHTPDTFFESFCDYAQKEKYDLPKYLNKANPEVFEAGNSMDATKKRLIQEYDTAIDLCKKELNNRLEESEFRFNLFIEEKHRLTVEFDSTIDRITALDLIFSSSALEFYEVHELGDVLDGLLDMEDAMTGRDITIPDTSDQGKIEFAEEVVMTADEIEEQYPISSKIQFPIDSENNFSSYESSMNNAIIGYALQEDTAFLSQTFRDPRYSIFLPEDCVILWEKIKDENMTDSGMMGLYVLHRAPNDYRILPKDIGDCKSRESEYSPGSYEVIIYFEGDGVSKWSSLTASNVGEFIAIVLDDQILSVPMVQQRIMGGECAISGNFTPSEAENLAKMIGSSDLSYPLVVVDEKIYK
ncbi:MAG: hypothetical protein MI810_00795 [Flavobacteriales bacterium]|nr:hypothetical protein [Flavobacteriales bacterium]